MIKKSNSMYDHNGKSGGKIYELDEEFNNFLEGKYINGRYRNLRLSETCDVNNYFLIIKYNELLKKQQKDNYKTYMELNNIDVKEDKKIELKDNKKVKDNNIKVKKSRKVTNSVKKQIAGKQYNKCANNPSIKAIGLGNYKCPLWQNNNNDIKGCFDESGYEIDHIVEHSITQNDDINNLQALCKSCHTVKTNNFNRKSNF